MFRHSLLHFVTWISLHLGKIRQNVLLKSVQNVCKVVIMFGTNSAGICRQALVIAVFVCTSLPDNAIIISKAPDHVIYIFHSKKRFNSANSHNIELPHDKTNKMTCTQWRLKSAWASAQSDQSIRYAHEETLGPLLLLLSAYQTGQMPRLMCVFAGHTSFF